MKTPREIVNLMMKSDAFSKWMQIEVVEIDKGACTLQLTVTDEMLNGFLITHGGISYSLSDSALAFASNSRGNKCVSIETSISHIRPTKKGDQLKAVAVEKHRGKTIGIYEITVVNQENKTVALFKGTVHISSEIW